MANKNFFSILPRDNDYMVNSSGGVPLNVIQSDGVEVEPDIKFNTITLSGNNKIFRNQSGTQDSFSVSILIYESDKITSGKFKRDTSKSYDEFDEAFWKFMPEVSADTSSLSEVYNVPVLAALDYWIRKAVPFYVYTSAIGISSKDLWLVTKQKSRKQTHRRAVIWDLTFTKYKQVNLGKFVSVSEGLEAVLKKKELEKEAKLKEKEKLKSELAKCDYKVLQYSEKKKTNSCVKKLQERLWAAGSFEKGVKKSEACDGWFGKTTKQAVINWQTKWGKSYGLRADGKVDEKTFNALCGKGKKINKKTSTTETTTISIDLPAGTDMTGASISNNPTVTVEAKDMRTYDVVNDPKKEKVTIDTSTKNLKTVTTTKNGTTVTKSSGKSTKVSTKSGKNNKNNKSGKSSGKNKKGGKKK